MSEETQRIEDLEDELKGMEELKAERDALTAQLEEFKSALSAAWSRTCIHHTDKQRQDAGCPVCRAAQVASLTSQLAKYEGILGGRLNNDLGRDPIEVALKEYVAAEDALSDEFDSDEYSLSNAVASLTSQLEQVTTDRDLARAGLAARRKDNDAITVERDEAREELAKRQADDVKDIQLGVAYVDLCTAAQEAVEALRFYANIENFEVTVWADETNDGECWTEPAKDHSLVEKPSTDFGIKAQEAADRLSSLLSPPEEKKGEATKLKIHANRSCLKCGGNGWIYKGHGEDEECDCIFIYPPKTPAPASLPTERTDGKIGLWFEVQGIAHRVAHKIKRESFYQSACKRFTVHQDAIWCPHNTPECKQCAAMRTEEPEGREQVEAKPLMVFKDEPIPGKTADELYAEFKEIKKQAKQDVADLNEGRNRP